MILSRIRRKIAVVRYVVHCARLPLANVAKLRVRPVVDLRSGRRTYDEMSFSAKRIGINWLASIGIHWLLVKINDSDVGYGIIVRRRPLGRFVDSSVKFLDGDTKRDLSLQLS